MTCLWKRRLIELGDVTAKVLLRTFVLLQDGLTNPLPYQK